MEGQDLKRSEADMQSYQLPNTGLMTLERVPLALPSILLESPILALFLRPSDENFRCCVVNVQNACSSLSAYHCSLLFGVLALTLPIFALCML